MSQTQIEDESRQKRAILTLTILVAALAGGCTLFLFIVLVLGGGKFDWEVGPARMISLVAMLAACGAVAIRNFAPRVTAEQMVKQLARRKDEPRWMDYFAIYQVTTIISAALLEGATFFLLIAHRTEHSPWTLLLAVLLILGILLHLPTRGRVERWIEDQQESVEDLRLLERR